MSTDGGKITWQYTQSGSTYCLTGRKGTTSFYVNGNDTILDGVCSGHTTSGGSNPSTPPVVVPVNLSESFAGSGQLNTATTGGKTWAYYNTSTWTKNGSGSSGYAMTTASPSANPMAVLDVQASDVTATIGTRSAPGAAIYFRVSDANNWLRLKVNRIQTSSVDTWYSGGYEYQARANSTE